MLSNRTKFSHEFFIPKKIVTYLGGFFANVQVGFIKNHLIKWFIRVYQVNMKEALEDNPTHYACFNDFFIRRLRADVRPIADALMTSPVDGCVSEIGRIEAGQLLQAKKLFYTVKELLGCDEETSARFINGYFTTLYLSPKDYHRVHMPITGTLKKMIYIPGALFSVQPSSAQTIPKLFARNERLVVYFETEIGVMAMVLVGATIVGAIGTTWHGDLKRQKERRVFDYSTTSNPTTLKKGEEMGHFKLGSTVILLLESSSPMTWVESLLPGVDLRLGESIGEKTRN